jgi:pantetheine-phosphate adenylyltransferase
LLLAACKILIMQFPEYEKYRALFTGYGMSEPAIVQLLFRWREPHRYYHTEAHLQFLLEKIDHLHAAGQINAQEQQTLQMVAFFHDAVYDPTAGDNEEQSARLFTEFTQPRSDADLIRQMILDTKTHLSSHPLSRAFIDLDMWIVTDAGLVPMLAWERGIAREFQFIDYGMYREGRAALLEGWAQKYPNNQTNLLALAAYVRQHRPNVGIYAGSFNPFHNGHVNILEKAERIFDKIIVARGVNPEKDGPGDFPEPAGILKYRQTERFPGLLTDYVTEKEKFAEITLVRGLRNGDDLAYEVNQLRFMEDMKPGLKVVFIRCDKPFEHISSSAIRNLEKIRKGLGQKYLPD